MFLGPENEAVPPSLTQYRKEGCQPTSTSVQSFSPALSNLFFFFLIFQIMQGKKGSEALSLLDTYAKH